MIKEIYVKNFILIDELHLDLNTDFSCFSGETGAGKSLLIDAISILCGDRASTQFIQKDAQKALIEATIEIKDQNHPALLLMKEAGYELDDYCFVISREFNQEAKSICRFNQRVTTLSFIKSIMNLLIDIHSQHDNQYLLNNKFHLSLLDEYMHENDLLNIVKQKYNDYNIQKKALKKLVEEDANPDDLEYLQYQLKEMNDLDIKENEIESLEEKQKEMASYDKIASKLSESINLIETSKYDHLYDVNKSLDCFDHEILIKAKEEIMNAYYSIDEQLANLKDYYHNLSFDETEFNAIQTRLFEINKLLRKHGNTYSNYLNKQKEMMTKIEFIEHRQDSIDKMESEMKISYDIFYKEALKLRELRKSKALLLETDIQNELKDLHLENAKFKIIFNETIHQSGIDEIEFLISMNVGEALKPLSKVASGGELSRLMLGLKTIFNRLAKIETIIFDEIDNGVSGSVAYAIGKKMNTIAKQSQVFAVTHLAPVAVWANQHYLVQKTQLDGKTNSTIRALDKEQIIHELAMIAQGNNSQQSLLAAQELYEKVHQ